MTPDERVEAAARALWDLRTDLGRYDIRSEMVTARAALTAAGVADIWDEGYEAGIRAGDRDARINPYREVQP